MKPPEYLSKKSKKLWEHFVGGRVKSPGRIEAFLQALQCLDRADQARTILEAEGLTTVTSKSGVAHAHPAVKIERENRALFYKIWSSLNLQWDSELDGGFPI